MRAWIITQCRGCPGYAFIRTRLATRAWSCPAEQLAGRVLCNNRRDDLLPYEQYSLNRMMFTNKVGFTIGTGRCGTLFLYHVMEKEPDVASSHERNPENEAFQRYCKWHRLPVDDEGFLAIKEREVRGDLEQRAYSFEASPYLALSVRELHERFGAKFLFVYAREPFCFLLHLLNLFFLSTAGEKDTSIPVVAIGAHFRRVSVLDDEHEMTGIDDAIAARANDLHWHAGNGQFPGKYPDCSLSPARRPQSSQPPFLRSSF